MLNREKTEDGGWLAQREAGQASLSTNSVAHF